MPLLFCSALASISSLSSPVNHSVHIRAISFWIIYILACFIKIFVASYVCSILIACPNIFKLLALIPFT
jgi:hypothetical protein